MFHVERQNTLFSSFRPRPKTAEREGKMVKISDSKIFYIQAFFIVAVVCLPGNIFTAVMLYIQHFSASATTPDEPAATAAADVTSSTTTTFATTIVDNAVMMIHSTMMTTEIDQTFLRNQFSYKPLWPPMTDLPILLRLCNLYLTRTLHCVQLWTH